MLDVAAVTVDKHCRERELQSKKYIVFPLLKLIQNGEIKPLFTYEKVFVLE